MAIRNNEAQWACTIYDKRAGVYPLEHATELLKVPRIPVVMTPYYHCGRFDAMATGITDTALYIGPCNLHPCYSQSH